jgi:hypothetical protein
VNISQTEHRLLRAAERTSISIVPYEAQYLEGTLEVAREIHAHSIYANMRLDEFKVIRQLSSSGLTVPDRYFRLAVRNNEVLGGFYGSLVKVFFSDECTAKDMGWWVKETARGGLAAVLLLADFEGWARRCGARKCMVGQSGVENIERTRKLFEHCGYSLTGYNTSKEL